MINKDEIWCLFFKYQKQKYIWHKNWIFKIKKILEVDSELKSELIKWDYETKNGEFKCRADEQNKLNVFYQNSFEFSDYTDGENVIYKCIKLFYSNTYRIVGIESNNLGGQGLLAYLLNQLIQPKIDVKYHMAMKKSDLLKEYFNDNKYSFLGENTCLPFESWENFLEEEPDEYGNNIKHYRKKIFI